MNITQLEYYRLLKEQSIEQLISDFIEANEAFDIEVIAGNQNLQKNIYEYANPEQIETLKSIVFSLTLQYIANYR